MFAKVEPDHIAAPIVSYCESYCELFLTGERSREEGAATECRPYYLRSVQVGPVALFGFALLPSKSTMQAQTEHAISAELRQRFLSARRVVMLTGAGISAESGVPTFRGGGNTAVWKGMPFDVISSAQMVSRDLPAVWEWFDYRRELLGALKPNAAHFEIARWQQHFSNLNLVTQNIDGLHQKAGSRDVIELHGNIWRACCITCQARYEIMHAEQRPEACLACGDPLRPDVVLFGEMLPAGAFETAAEAAANCELCFVIGTSAVVYPAAGLPEIAGDAGAYVVEVNPERTPLSDLCDEVIMGKAGEVLPLFSRLSDNKGTAEARRD